MLTDVMEHYGLVREFRRADFYETDDQKKLFKDITASVYAGQLIALTGVVGCGKTRTLRELLESLTLGGKIIVSKSLSVDKKRATLATLIEALFYDLSQDKEIKIATKGEKRERDLRDLFKKHKKPVLLAVDEAHDLHGLTLIGIKRLIEMAEDNKCTLSVLLSGHPKLRNYLRRPTMEEIGYRTTIFSLDNLIGNQYKYTKWLVNACIGENIEIDDVIEEDALELLGSRLRTPLQIEQYLIRAFETAYKVGEKPVTKAIVESELSKEIDELEAILTRHGYDTKTLTELFSVTPKEIRQFYSGRLEPQRMLELRGEMLAAGLPV